MRSELGHCVMAGREPAIILAREVNQFAMFDGLPALFWARPPGADTRASLARSLSSSTSAVFISDSRRISPTRSFMIVCSSLWMV